ncbi:MAG: M48 family metallopeptidase [Alphaproteobacteria bacterium]|nr:M48 family metallopeptidase [Alphaproteobacteria bacterium]
MTLASEKSDQPVHGYLLDGKSPRKQNFALSVNAKGIRYALADGPSGEWGFDSIDWERSPLKARPLYLKSMTVKDAWLVVSDAKAVQDVLRAQNIWAEQNFWRFYAAQKKAAAYLACVLVFFAALWLGWPVVADGIAAANPPALRRYLDEMAGAYLSDQLICHSPDGEKALSEIQRRLAEKHPDLNTCNLVVIDSDSVNAFTIPGNQVVLTNGLLENARNGDEIAGVLAHEFGHVINNHVMRGFLRNTVPQLAISSVWRAVGVMPSMANYAIDTANSRTFERAADASAVILLKDAGISAEGVRDFFARLSKETRNSRAMAFMSDHPATEDRAAMMDEAVAEQQKTSPVLDRSQWLALQRICE